MLFIDVGMLKANIPPKNNNGDVENYLLDSVAKVISWLNFSKNEIILQTISRQQVAFKNSITL